MKSKSEAFVSDFLLFSWSDLVDGQRALVTFRDLLSLLFLSLGQLA
jgi:hypothetical protein